MVQLDNDQISVPKWLDGLENTKYSFENTLREVGLKGKGDGQKKFTCDKIMIT